MGNLQQEMDEAEASHREATIRAAVLDWTARLNLKDWDVAYDPRLDPDDGSWASLDYRTAEKVAVIAVGFDVPTHDLEACVVHELLHLTMVDLTDNLDRLVAQVHGDSARTVLAELLEDQQETLIETLTRALLPKAGRLVVGEGKGWANWAFWKRRP